jgi:hypothetical protein
MARTLATRRRPSPVSATRLHTEGDLGRTVLALVPARTAASDLTFCVLLPRLRLSSGRHSLPRTYRRRATVRGFAVTVDLRASRPSQGAKAYEHFLGHWGDQVATARRLSRRSTVPLHGGHSRATGMSPWASVTPPAPAFLPLPPSPTACPCSLRLSRDHCATTGAPDSGASGAILSRVASHATGVAVCSLLYSRLTTCLGSLLVAKHPSLVPTHTHVLHTHTRACGSGPSGTGRAGNSGGPSGRATRGELRAGYAGGRGRACLLFYVL